ncbi:signal peptide peptidase SppA [Marinicella gelatinilytica]|uniref:signal peptide peptidase SppA n=1 Tax=Marinicella gelatinilytica TaxID=2996017 RepID=UPI002260F61F|nr:signal peptide peptidase SppA [Marinicella gelatinilytica]MCX7545690.1 signal peptide peptidase SppA [Marinicella gelatinilytica]
MNTKTQKSSPVRTFFGFFTKPFVLIANFTRHIILLLIFILILWLIFGGQKIHVSDKTALVLAPTGFIVDQYSGNPAMQALQTIQGTRVPETRMRDIVRSLEMAAADDSISALVINPDELMGVGLAHLREIGDAVKRFKDDSGKPVIAMATSLSQSQYYLASLADEILMDPQGFLFIQGFGGYRSYFKEGLDKLGVDVHLFRVGEYKSAAEPYVRNSMSEEAKEANLHFMNDLWQTFLQDIGERRNLSVAELTSIIDDQASRLQAKNGSVADMALEAGLVDRILKQPFMHKRIAEVSSFDDEGNHFRGINFKDYLTLDLPQLKAKNQVAVVVAEGVIMPGQQPAGTIGGDSTSALLEKALLNKKIKAVVLRVNSPGGGVYPSEQIRRQVEALQVAGKPVVVSMANVAASGGYWISMTADSIWANEGTITGSIGIYGMFMTIPKLFDKLGIHSDGVGTTQWVGAFNPDRPLDPEFAKLIQSNIEYGYQQFITAVAMARGLEVSMVDQVARGRVWTAKQAKDLGLIDQLGNLQQAIKDAADRAGLSEDYQVSWLEKELSFTEQMLADSMVKMASLMEPRQVSGQMQLQQLLAPMMADMQLFMNRRPGEVVELAHCLCQAPQL